MYKILDYIEKKLIPQSADQAINDKYSYSAVNIDGVSLEVAPGMIRLYTDYKPYKIIVDGEIIRWQ